MKKIITISTIILLISLPIAIIFGCAAPAPTPAPAQAPALTSQEYLERGVALAKEGQYEQAISEFTKAIELNPNTVAAYVKRSNVYFQTGQYELAIDDCNKAIEIDPNNAGTYVIRAIAYTFLGMDDQARADAEQAIALGFDRLIVERMIEQVNYMPRITPDEDPAWIVWKQEGIVEDVALNPSWLFTTDFGECIALEIRAVVTEGTLDDDARISKIIDRIIGDLTFHEKPDVIIVKLVEQSKVGALTTTDWTFRAFPKRGKEYMLDQAIEVWKRTSITTP